MVLDIRALCRSGRQFHVEVQVRTFVAYPERMLFYWSGMYSGQLASGQSYRLLAPVYSVHILGFHLLPDDEGHRHYHHVFELRERRTGHRLTDHLQMHTIEMPKFLRGDDRSTTEAKWLYFLQHSHEMSEAEVHALGLPELDRAEEQLRVISQDRKLRMQYEQQMKAERDALSWKADWLEEGKQEGKRLGLVSSIEDICELLGIALTSEQREDLARRDLAALEQLRQHLKTRRAWP